MNDYVLTFDSTHAALSAQKALAQAEVSCFTIPTPRAISAGCGIALKIQGESVEAVRSLISRTETRAHWVYLQKNREEFERVL
ncbi:MAG: DUF3343 domain-containing protein [Eggerthellaceae bacterium]|nr:DUF3343 domain-containing protein [Eggerthellaceae bacterium]